MICKTANITHSSNALNYAEKGGELIHANGVWGDAKEINKEFQLVQASNDKAKYKSSHSIISFNPEDKMEQLTDQDLIDISEKYAKAQGFDQNQYAVYLHQDKDHIHLHIVSNRINNDAKCVSSSNNYYKNKDFAKAMEKEYNLIPTNRLVKEKGMSKEAFKEISKNFKPDNSRANSIKQVLDTCISNSSTIEQFSKEVEQYGIKVHRGRGIAFTDKEGATFKGSQIGREYSLKGIEKQINQKDFSITPAREKAQGKENFVPRQQQTERPDPGQQSTHIPFESFTPMFGGGGNTNDDYEDEIDELKGKKKKKRNHGRGR